MTENVLDQLFDAAGPNTTRVRDITCLPTVEGRLHLAAHKDLLASEIVGYASGERITKNLVSQSLLRAAAAKRPGKGLIHHSNRGSQYCVYACRKLFDQFGMVASMSRKGSCYGNASMEPGNAQAGTCPSQELPGQAGGKTEADIQKRTQSTARPSNPASEHPMHPESDPSSPAGLFILIVRPSRNLCQEVYE